MTFCVQTSTTPRLLCADRHHFASACRERRRPTCRPTFAASSYSAIDILLPPITPLKTFESQHHPTPSLLLPLSLALVRLPTYLPTFRPRDPERQDTLRAPASSDRHRCRNSSLQLPALRIAPRPAFPRPATKTSPGCPTTSLRAAPTSSGYVQSCKRTSPIDQREAAAHLSMHA